MNEDLFKESNPRMLALSAGMALLAHGIVFFSWTKISMEQNAYAIGSLGNINLVLEAAQITSTEKTTSKEVLPVSLSEPVKVPTEFKKQLKSKPVEKKREQEVPVSSISNSAQPGANQEVSTKAIGDTLGLKSNGSVIAEPDYLNNPPPKYPNESRRKYEEGVVMIHAAINPGGRVENLSVSKSSGFDRLDEAATSAVKNWKFKPARFAGVAIESSVEIPVRFSLR